MEDGRIVNGGDGGREKEKEKGREREREVTSDGEELSSSCSACLPCLPWSEREIPHRETLREIDLYKYLKIHIYIHNYCLK